LHYSKPLALRLDTYQPCNFGDSFGSVGLPSGYVIEGVLDFGPLCNLLMILARALPADEESPYSSRVSSSSSESDFESGMS